MLNAEVENILTSFSIDNALSANMGRVLNNTITDIEERVTNLEDKSSIIRKWT